MATISECRYLPRTRQTGHREVIEAQGVEALHVVLFEADIHSFSFDHRRRPETFLTAMATAFFWPTRTTRRFPRVTPV
jgi:hypothetical protein